MSQVPAAMWDRLANGGRDGGPPTARGHRSASALPVDRPRLEVTAGGDAAGNARDGDRPG
jgi:hypothetical protein